MGRCEFIIYLAAITFTRSAYPGCRGAKNDDIRALRPLFMSNGARSRASGGGCFVAVWMALPKNLRHRDFCYVGHPRLFGNERNIFLFILDAHAREKLNERFCKICGRVPHTYLLFRPLALRWSFLPFPHPSSFSHSRESFTLSDCVCS